MMKPSRSVVSLQRQNLELIFGRPPLDPLRNHEGLVQCDMGSSDCCHRDPDTEKHKGMDH